MNDDGKSHITIQNRSQNSKLSENLPQRNHRSKCQMIEDNRGKSPDDCGFENGILGYNKRKHDTGKHILNK